MTKNHYEVRQAFSCGEAGKLLAERVDLFLVDIGLPDGDGVSLCRKIQEQSQAPVIFLTARDEEEDMLGAFNAGADDYVVKPFPMQVLLKRIQAVLRRKGESQEAFSYQGLRVDFKKKSVSLSGREIPLTPKEYRLLEFMVRNKGQVLSKEAILEHVWDVDGNFVGENTVSVTVNRLRKKIEEDPVNPAWLHNVFGMGYRFGE